MHGSYSHTTDNYATQHSHCDLVILCRRLWTAFWRRSSCGGSWRTTSAMCASAVHDRTADEWLPAQKEHGTSHVRTHD